MNSSATCSEPEKISLLHANMKQKCKWGSLSSFPFNAPSQSLSRGRRCLVSEASQTTICVRCPDLDISIDCYIMVFATHCIIEIFELNIMKQLEHSSILIKELDDVSWAWTPEKSYNWRLCYFVAINEFGFLHTTPAAYWQIMQWTNALWSLKDTPLTFTYIQTPFRLWPSL